jgi:hypothetical protein
MGCIAARKCTDQVDADQLMRGANRAGSGDKIAFRSRWMKRDDILVWISSTWFATLLGGMAIWFYMGV